MHLDPTTLCQDTFAKALARPLRVFRGLTDRAWPKAIRRISSRRLWVNIKLTLWTEPRQFSEHRPTHSLKPF